MPELPRIVLASSSPYRRTLLSRLRLPFETCSPDIDERRLADEPVEQLVTRLAINKALAVAERYPNALIIGSDQVAALGESVLGKPGNRENAIKQLQAMRSASVDFVTGLCLVNSATGHRQSGIVHFRVVFRQYSDAEIERYLDLDLPYDCAGSFKSEQLGIALIERMEGEDPSALMGLPLIELARMLRQESVAVP
jgi:septum formation protein